MQNSAKKIKLSLVASLLLTTSVYAQNSNNLGAITVSSATKSTQFIKDITSNIEVITGAEIEEKHYNSLADVLRNVANISIAQSGGVGQTSSFFLRGFSSGNTLVMINGVKYNDPTGTEGQAQLEHINISDIERIEIIKGAQSGIWGANAVAGVINIITKKATKKLQINAQASVGSMNTKNIKMSISQKVDKFSYYVGASQLSTDSVTAIVPKDKDKDDFEDDEYKNKTLNTNLGYEFSDIDDMEVGYSKIDANVDYDNDPSWSATSSVKANSTDYEIKQKNSILNVAYTHHYSKDNYSKIYYLEANFKKNDLKGTTKKFEAKNTEQGVDNKIKYSDNGFVLFGLNSAQAKDKIKNRTLSSKAIYITNSNTLSTMSDSDTVFTQSLRKDIYSDFDDKTTGKIGVKHFHDDFIFSLNYGTAYKAPSLQQLFDPTYGNKNLKPETTKSKDLTVEYKDFKVTYFDNSVNDLIGYDSVTYVNKQVSGTSKFKGYELSYNTSFNDDILLGFNYNTLSAKDKDNKDLIRRIQKSARLNLDYYGFAKHHFGLDINYVGKRVDTDYSAFPAKEVQTGKYTLVNFVADHIWNKKNTTFIKINNLTDKDYQEVYGYATASRSFYIGHKISF